MNPKLTYVTLGCTISIIDISITYFKGESYIRILRNTHLVSMLIRDLLMKIVTIVKVSCWWYAMRIYVFPSGLGS